MIRIGIDPPRGLAIADNGVLIAVESHKDLAWLYRALARHFEAYEVVEVVIETPHGIGTRLGRGLSINARMKISANIGQVYQSARAVKAFCDAAGINSVLQKSSKHMTKWPADRFAGHTGYRGKTNEHGRDAALLVFGRV